MPTLRHTLGNIVSTPLTMVRLSLMKTFYPHNIFYRGIERFSPGVVVDTDRESRIRFGRRVSLHSRCRITAVSGGEVCIGDNTSFNVGCIVVSRCRIEIGKNVSLGPNVLIYDHDHIMDGNCGTRGTGYNLGAVEIGDNTWIGAGTIILLGSRIGKNCVIAAGSVVKGDVPDHTRLVQKRVSIIKGIE